MAIGSSLEKWWGRPVSGPQTSAPAFLSISDPFVFAASYYNQKIPYTISFASFFISCLNQQLNDCRRTNQPVITVEKNHSSIIQFVSQSIVILQTFAVYLIILHTASRLLKYLPGLFCDQYLRIPWLDSLVVRTLINFFQDRAVVFPLVTHQALLNIARIKSTTLKTFNSRNDFYLIFEFVNVNFMIQKKFVTKDLFNL